MKKIMKSLKWYFSHLNWRAALVITVLIMGLDIISSHHFNWVLFIGLSVIVLIVPIMGILQSKINTDRQIYQKKIMEELGDKEQKIEEEDVLDYLSTIPVSDRLELLKKVQEKTKGKK